MLISDYSWIRSSCIRLRPFGEFSCTLMTHGKALSKLGERLKRWQPPGGAARRTQVENWN
jgi:hypothetical protein